MFSMLLTFCALAGSPCFEIEPVTPPESISDCVTGGQAAAAEWLHAHPMVASRLKFAGWKCTLGKRGKKT